MADPVRSVVIGYLQLGTPTATDLWCPWCLLPSGIEWPVSILSEHGVSPAGTFQLCYDCGRNLREQR